ncbi:MAG: TonB-dependent receptor plug domain-containing protein, partial [Odoribacter sp.]|nr:TonB-dependent receptor plug domain-containing protein [Odoribacter sp.]
MRFIFLKLILLCIIAIPSVATAQQKTLHGIVRDNIGGMIGVNVVWENKEGRAISGVTTNENGEYWLPLLTDMKDLNVVFSFIGMKTKKVKYTGQEVLNIILEEENVSLDEVVITAKAEKRNSMGINQENSGVARQKLDLDEFQDMAVTSVEDILQGKMTNVDIIMDSGDPGAKSSIRIRGTSSLNSSNEPLIVIDDVPQDIDIDESFEFGTATTEDFGALVNIAPNDIANIEVLKDAAATALYGPQAAAGVLLITTKRGVKSKPRFTITNKTTVSWEPKAIPLLNASEYRTLMQDALWNAVQYNGFNDMSLLTSYPDVRLDESYEYYDEFNRNTDWLSLVVQTPVSNETNFSMTGGGDRAVYYFSVGYLTEPGTTIGTDFSRVTARLNLDYNLSKKLRFSSSFSYAEGNKNRPYDVGVQTPRAEALRKMPNMSPWVLDDEGNPTDVYFTQPKDCIQGLQPNPVAIVHNSNVNTIQRTMSANFVIDYRILPYLTFNTNIAFDLGTTKTKSLYPGEASGVIWSSDKYNRAEDATSNKMSMNTRTRLTFNKFFQKHQVTLSGILTTKEYN